MVVFAGLPANTTIVFVNQTSGQALSQFSTALASGGSGTAVIPISETLPGGAYYLAAQDAGGNRLAQTVQFYVSGGSDEDT